MSQDAGRRTHDNSLQDLLKRVRRIEIKSRQISRKLFTGDYHSAFKGRGMSFAEVRPYQYGDDVRFIDWNVTARYKEPYIKTYEEEREFTVILMVDLSRSGAFGTQKMTKRELLTELSAVLAISADSNNDKVGAVFFTDKIERYIPPRKGRTHILRIIRELLDFEPENSGTDIANALTFITRAIKRKSIVFLVSDFNDERYGTSLGIATRQHDLIGIQVFDIVEQELPDAGLILAKDPESGAGGWIDTSSEKTRAHYKAAFLEKSDYFRKQFHNNGADCLSIRTDQSYMPALHNFLKNRGSLSQQSGKKNMLLSWIIFLIFCCNFGFHAKAQEISAKASAPKTEYPVGDRIDLKIELKRPENFSFYWDRKNFESDQLELADSITTDSTVDKNFIRTTIHLPLAGFDSGKVVFPAQVFVFRKSGDTTPFILKTTPIEFHISTITVNLDKDIKPIDGPVKPGFDWLKFAEHSLLLLVLTGIVIIIILLYLRNRRREKELFSNRPVIPQAPWEIAIEKLAALKKQNLPAIGKTKDYYSALSDILRQFFTEMFRVDAMELTTHELITSLRSHGLNAIKADTAFNLLELSDSVKFAKYIPAESDHEQSMKEAFELVGGMRDDAIYIGNSVD